MRDGNVLDIVYGEPWALREDKLGIVVAVAEAHAAGLVRARAHEAEAEREARFAAREGVQVGNAVGVIPIHGVIFPRGSALTKMSGLTTTTAIDAQLREMLASDEVGSIILDIDSPGGLLQGVPELAETIFRARGSKPIVALAWNMAASAAYYLASQADEIVVTPSGEVGSIGVLMVHADHSKRFEAEGVKHTIIRAGKFKAEANAAEPLSAEARAYLQTRIDEDYGHFVRAVARGRGVSVDTVRGGFGEGRTVGAEKAVELEMADRVGTFAETVRRLSTGQGRSRVGKRREATARAIKSRLQV